MLTVSDYTTHYFTDGRKREFIMQVSLLRCTHVENKIFFFVIRSVCLPLYNMKYDLNAALKLLLGFTFRQSIVYRVYLY